MERNVLPAGDSVPTEAELRISGLTEDDSRLFYMAVARNLAKKGARDAFRSMSRDDAQKIGELPLPDGWS